MKIKRLVEVGSASVVGLSSLMVLALAPASAATGTYYKWTGAASATPGAGTCTTNCWSVAGNWDVSNDGGTTYTSPATTAPQSTDNSNAGDNIVFDNTGLAAQTTTTNDLTNLVVNTISSINSNNSGNQYTVDGNGIKLTAGLVNTPSASTLNLALPITVTANQTWGSNGQLNVDYNQVGLTVNQGVTLTLDSGSSSISSVAGAGALVLATPPNTQTWVTYHWLTTANASFTGSVDVKSGTTLEIDDKGALGTAAVTIEDGGQLLLNDNYAAATDGDSWTIPNDITMAGDAGQPSSAQQGAIMAGMYNTTTNKSTGTFTVNFSGTVTLTGDTQLAAQYPTDVVYNFTGTLNKNGHVLGAVTKSQPTYGNTTIQANGTAIDQAAAPATPNTGFALVSAHPMTSLIVSSAAALAIAAAARRTKTARR